jgi:transposase
MAHPRYSSELRKRAVRMLLERREDYKCEWATVTAVVKLFGMSPESLRTWLRRAQIDGGAPGLSANERARLKQFERENKDLRRANALLKDASMFFATEIDVHTRFPQRSMGSSRSAQCCSSPAAVTTPQSPARRPRASSVTRSLCPRSTGSTSSTATVSTARSRSGSS